MTKILLVDPDECHAREIALFFERRQCFVNVCTQKDDAVNEFKRKGGCFDVLCFAMMRDREEDWGLLGHLCKLRRPDGTGPVVICIGRGYRGPRMRMRVERLGARLIYERQL